MNVTPTEYASSAIAYTNVFSFDQGGVIDQYDRPIDFAGQILEADMQFNPSEMFSTNTPTPADRFDIQAIATHEIGHFIGLDHSTQISSTMFPFSIHGVNYARSVALDDIAGVSSIYPRAEFSSKGTLTGTVRRLRILRSMEPWWLPLILRECRLRVLLRTPQASTPLPDWIRVRTPSMRSR